MEKLHREWRAKYDAAQTDEEKREIEDQMAYLGGDAVHSILVRGLDYALLEQQKAKAEGRTLLGNVDEDLEAAYAENADERGKRSREEVVEILKRKRQGGKEGVDEGTDAQKAQVMSKFKPIGSTISQQNSGGDDNVIITKDGKRLRKKKKKAPAESEAAKGFPDKETSTSSTREKPRRDGDISRAKVDQMVSTQHDSVSRKEKPSIKQGVANAQENLAQRQEPPPPSSNDRTEPPHRASPERPDDTDTKPPMTMAASTTAAPASDEEEDEDIFADAGRWSGLARGEGDDDDSESENE